MRLLALVALTALHAAPVHADPAASGSTAPHAASTPTSATSADALKREVDAQNEALVQKDFNFTRGMSLTAAKSPYRFELLLPETSEREVHLWMGAPDGQGAFRMVGPGGKEWAHLSGRGGDTDLDLTLPKGTYQVELSTSKGAVYAVFGLKGSVVGTCPVDAAKVSELAASDAQGFSWPYLLYVPEHPTAGHLMVAPNNTGFPTTDVAMLRAAATCPLRQEAALAESLGAPLLVPLFPRPEQKGPSDNLYLHALTRAALTTRVPKWRRVDLQLLAMVKDARARLSQRGVSVGRGLLLDGFSASASFVNRFAMLHPGDVLAVASVSPGGWPTAPLRRLGRVPLPYPVGIDDLATLVGHAPSPNALKDVRWFFLLGEEDANDAVPHRDSFSATDQTLVFRLFGKTPIERFPIAERLYREAGLHARFQTYPGTGHERSPAMRADLTRFFQDALHAQR